MLIQIVLIQHYIQKESCFGTYVAADLTLRNSIKIRAHRIEILSNDGTYGPISIQGDKVVLDTGDLINAVKQRLVDRGVLIRQTGPDGWLRVSIGTPDENNAFRKALEEGDA